MRCGWRKTWWAGLLMLLVTATSGATEPAFDPARPAASLALLVEQAGRLAEANLATTALEARARQETPREASRTLLAAAAVHLARGDRFAVKRCALAARTTAGATDPLAAAAALLLLQLNTQGFPSPGGPSPLDSALALYRQVGHAEGQSLCQALQARQLAAWGLRVGDGDLPTQVTAQVDRLVAAVERGPHVPVADLQAAWACEILGERLLDCAGGAGPASGSRWFERAAGLARRAAPTGAVQSGAALQLTALNLTLRARLEPLVRCPPTGRLDDEATAFAAYDTAVNQALLACDDPVALLCGSSGAIANLSRYSRLLATRPQPNREVIGHYARRLLLLTQAVLPLAEEPPGGTAAAETILGLPDRTGTHEHGLLACRLLNTWLGQGASEDDPRMASYQEFGFWFYEQTRSTQVARTLARLTGEAQPSPATAARRAELEQERTRLGVELIHQSASRIGALRLGQPRGGLASGTRGPLGEPRGGGRRPGNLGQPGARDGRPGQGGPGEGPLGRYQQVRRQLLELDLGGDEEARQLAALLDRRLTTAEARRLLPDQHSAIVAYGADWAFVITPDRVDWHAPTPPGNPRAVSALAGSLGNPQAPLADRLTAARTLYDAYVRPLEPSLRGIDHLLLAPEGPLACLPFEALVSGSRARDGARPTSWADACYLGDRYSIDYLPSLTMLALTQARNRQLDRQVPRLALAVGDVKLPADLELGTAATRFVLVPIRSGADHELLKLPFTGLEARRVVEELGVAQSTLLLGEQATESAVRAELPRHRVLHFATHGVLADEGDPLGAGLLLSPEAGGQPGLLTARDVYGLRLPARLAVLSACDTATGKLRFVSGGVTSLAGAFRYAGVPNVVASLWPVDDEATAAFMGHFYQSDLRRPGDEAAALRAARSAVRQDHAGRWADPYYWAAFLMFR